MQCVWVVYCGISLVHIVSSYRHQVIWGTQKWVMPKERYVIFFFKDSSASRVTYSLTSSSLAVAAGTHITFPDYKITWFMATMPPTILAAKFGRLVLWYNFFCCKRKRRVSHDLSKSVLLQFVREDRAVFPFLHLPTQNANTVGRKICVGRIKGQQK